ncbi:response regulator [Proteobacteria bacterium 005FR1]|nr:response regulator [Proteobacteria bacterium 005FR1]
MSCPSTPRSESDATQANRGVTAQGERCRPAADYSAKPDAEEDADPDASELAAANAKLNKNLQELTQTYRELEDVVSTAEATFLFVDFELKLQRFTRNAIELFGLRDRDRGRPVAMLSDKLNYPDLERDAVQVLREAKPLQTEVHGFNGRWYLVRLKPDFIDADRADGVVVSFVDITDRKQAEVSTYHARRFAEKILESLQQPIIVLSPDLRIKSANPAFYRSFNYRKENTEGKSILTIGNGRWDCPKFRELLERVLPENESFDGFELTQDFGPLGQRTLELGFRRLDSEQLILLAVHDITLDRQVDGLRQRETSLVHEVEVRQRLQEMASAVLQSGTMSEMFGYVLDASMELTGAECSTLQIVTEDDDLELVAQRGFDPAALGGHTSAEAGSPCMRAYHTRQRVMIEDVRHEESFESHRDLIEQMGFRALQATPLIGRSGKLLGVLCTHNRKPRKLSRRDEYVLDLLALEIADLCEWLKTEKRLRQSETRLRAQSEQLLANDRQKNQFLALLGHELRNPLTVMRNSIQTLVNEEHAFTSHPRISEALALLERQSRHMTHLVNDLLDITRINNGKVVLKRERVSLPRCLEEVVAAHRATINNRQLKFAVSQPQSPIYLDADVARLFQVLDNLLTNAIKFTQPGGSIQVDLGCMDGTAEIRVKDTGIGIPPESLETLFDPFTQVDNSLACHGLGLGLSLVRSLVSLHGGDIRAHSEGEDRGSEFIIHWPMHKRQAEAVADAAPPALHRHATARPQRILVVDDIPDIADSFARLLEVAGHEVIVAYNAEQGLDLARQHQPTVAFLDMIMPETDGLELARQLRHYFSPRDLTLVVVSGYGQSQDIDKARAAGFDHHLLKPIEVQQVYTLLDSLTTGFHRPH